MMQLMPPGEFTLDKAREWAATLAAQEIADCSAQLYAAQPYAEQLAGELATSADPLQAILAFNIYGRLLAAHAINIHDFLRAADKALDTSNVNVRYAAIRALQRCANINDCYFNLAKTTLETHNLGDWLG